MWAERNREIKALGWLAHAGHGMWADAKAKATDLGPEPVHQPEPEPEAGLTVSVPEPDDGAPDGATDSDHSLLDFGSKRRGYAPGYRDGRLGRSEAGSALHYTYDSDWPSDAKMGALTDAERQRLSFTAASIAIWWRARIKLAHKRLRSRLNIGYISTQMCCARELKVLADLISKRPPERLDVDIEAVYARLIQWERGHGGTFFTKLDGETARKAVRMIDLKAVRANTTLWSQGDASDDTFYFILSGAVDVIIDGEVKNINGGRGLGPSTSFGEAGLVSDDSNTADLGERSAGIKTKEDTLFLTLSRIDFLTVSDNLSNELTKVLQTQPEHRSPFQLRLLQQHLDRVMASASGAMSFTKRLSRCAGYQKLRSRDVLFRQGDEAEAFYIILSGYVQVVIDGNAVGCLGPGEAFGEAGLNLHDPDAPAAGIRTAGITAGFEIGLPGAPTFEELEEMMKKGQLADGGAANLMKKNRRKKEKLQRENSKKQGKSASTTELMVVSKEAFKKLVGGTRQKIKEVLETVPAKRTAEDVELLVDLLATTPFFDVITAPVQQKRCCRQLQLKEGYAGEYLFKKDDFGDLFYILVEGEVRGELPNGKTFILPSGASFGELAVLGTTEEEQKRSCAMVCTRSSLFATLAREDYMRLAGSLPDQAMQILCKRADNRTPQEFQTLLTFFSDSEFFKELHFDYLQMLVAEHMTLRGLKCPDALFEQGDYTEGHLYFLLSGRLQPIIDGKKAAKPYEPVQVFWDADLDGSMHDEETEEPDPQSPKKTVEADSNNLKCCMTVHAMQRDNRDGSAMKLVVTGLPQSWSGPDLYETFKFYGDIQSVQMSEVELPNSHKKQKAGFVTFENGISAQQAAKDEIMVDTGRLHKERLTVQFASELADSNKLLKSHEMRYRDMKKNEVVVAHLSKDNYTKFVVGALEELTTVLLAVPQKRTLKQLSLLATVFEATSILRAVKMSKMLVRNLCRFMGCQIFRAGDRIYRRGQVGDRVFIVLKGAVALRKTILASVAVGAIAPTLCHRGAELGTEILDSQDERRYQMVCTAATDVIVAVLLKEDFMRIVDIEPMQTAIDKLWQLGIEHNADEDSDDEGLSATVDTRKALLSFEGYRAVYERIVKTIAENHLTKKSDREQALHDDWENDLENYGDPDSHMLTHDQYSSSLYQLVDEWCGGVEYTGMYIKMLELIVENSTFTDKDGNIQLVRVKHQVSRYQQLMDARAKYQKYQQSVLSKTKVGTSKIGETLLNVEDAWGDILKSDHLSHTGKLITLPDEVDEEEDDGQLEFYKQMFDSVDDDGSGELDKDELIVLCEKMGRELNGVELNLAMAEMDQDGGGTVSFEEFSKWYKKLSEGDVLLEEVFQSVDLDGSGSLNRDELQEVFFQLGKTPTEQQLDEAMATMDDSGDGEVDFEEFKGWFNEWSAKQELIERQEAFKRLVKFDAGKAKVIFDNIDEDGSGELDQDELYELCSQLGREMTEPELVAAMIEMDTDNGGTIGFEEFLTWFQALTDGDNLLREVFDAVDMDGGGVLDREEVGEVMIQLGLYVTEDKLDEIMSKMDEDGSGEVEFEEFAEWFNDYRAQQKRMEAFDRLAHFDVTKAQEIFGEIDKDGSGGLDRDEVAQLCEKMGRQMTRKEIDAAMREMDTDGGGTISFEEFKVWFNNVAQGDDLLRDVFDSVDTDGGGVLDRDEVAQVILQLGMTMSEESLNQVMQIMDADGSGEVEFPEFQNWFSLHRAGQRREAVHADLLPAATSTKSRVDQTPSVDQKPRADQPPRADQNSNVDQKPSVDQKPDVDPEPSADQKPSVDQRPRGDKDADQPSDVGKSETLTQHTPDQTKCNPITMDVEFTEDENQPEAQLLAEKREKRERRERRVQNANLRREKKKREKQEQMLQKRARQDTRRQAEQRAQLNQVKDERRMKQEKHAERIAAQQMAKEKEEEIKICSCASCQLGEPCAVQRGRLRRAGQKAPDPLPELTAHLSKFAPVRVIYSVVKIQAFWRRLFGLRRTDRLRAGRYFYGFAIAKKDRLGVNAQQLSDIMSKCNREVTRKECDWAMDWCENSYMRFEQFYDWSMWLHNSSRIVFDAFTAEIRGFEIDGNGNSEISDSFMLSSTSKDSIRTAQQSLAEAERQHGHSAWTNVKQALRSFAVPVEVLPGIVRRLAEAIGVGALDADTTDARLLRTEMRELIDSYTFKPDKLKSLLYLDEWVTTRILPQIGSLPKTVSVHQQWSFGTPHVVSVLRSLCEEAQKLKAEAKSAKAKKAKSKGKTRVRAVASNGLRQEEQEPEKQQEQKRQHRTAAERKVDNSRRIASAASVSEGSFAQAGSQHTETSTPTVAARLSANELIAKFLRVVTEDSNNPDEVVGPVNTPGKAERKMKRLRHDLPADLRPWTGEQFITRIDQGQHGKKDQQNNTPAANVMNSTISSMNSTMSEFGTSRQSTGFSLHTERKIDPSFFERLASPRTSVGVPGSTTAAAEVSARYDHVGQRISTTEAQAQFRAHQRAQKAQSRLSSTYRSANVTPATSFDAASSIGDTPKLPGEKAAEAAAKKTRRPLALRHPSFNDSHKKLDTSSSDTVVAAMKTAYDFRQDGLALEKHREKRAAAKAMRIAEEQKVVAAAATTKKPKPKEASLSSTDELQKGDSSSGSIDEELCRERMRLAATSSMRATSIDLPLRKGYPRPQERLNSIIAIDSKFALASGGMTGAAGTPSGEGGKKDGTQQQKQQQLVFNSKSAPSLPRCDYKQQPVTWERFNATTSDSLHMRSDDEDGDVQYGVASNVTSAHLNKSMPNLRQGNRISGSTSLPTIQRSRSGRTGRGGRKSGHSTKKKPPWNKRQHNPSTLPADGSIAPAKAWALAKLHVYTEESGAGTFKPGSMGKRALAKLARYQPVGAVRGPASATRSYAMYRMPV